jgi:hypothetical protein
MFSDFETMFKKQADKITKSIPTNLIGDSPNEVYCNMIIE